MPDETKPVVPADVPADPTKDQIGVAPAAADLVTPKSGPKQPDPVTPVTPAAPVVEVDVHPEDHAPPAAPKPVIDLNDATAATPVPPVTPATPPPATPATPANDAAPVAPEEEGGDPKLKSKFITDDNIKALLTHLGRDKLAKELEDVLAMNDKGSTSFGKDKDGHATLTLGVNQHMIDFNQLPDGRDFIGLNQAHSNVFDAHDARAIVGLAKSRGWESITVHGNDDQKGALWLEAMRMGVGVKDFAPKPDSAVAQQWEKEKAAQPQPPAPEEAPAVTPVAVPMSVTQAAPAAAAKKPPPAPAPKPS